MTALARDEQREIIGHPHALDTIKAKADQVFFKGSGILVGTDGYAYVATTVTGRRSVGVAAYPCDTTGLDDGEASVVVQPGCVGWFDNSASSDEIAEDDKFKTVYWVDDATLALTDGGSTRTAAGAVFDVDADGKVALTFTEYKL